MSEPLSALQQARLDALKRLADHYTDFGRTLANDLSNPENQDATALSGDEWAGLCKILARFGLLTARLTADTISTEV